MAAVKKSVSVKDVARLAGVSEQTVSRTVHDSPSVRPETKERVRAAMRELGYRPNFCLLYTSLEEQQGFTGERSILSGKRLIYQSGR